MNKLIHIAKTAFLPKTALFLILNGGFARFARAQVKLQNPIKYDAIGDIVQAAAGLVATIAVPIAALFIAYSGFLFVTARGNDAQLIKARQTLLWSVVGTAVILGAYAIAVALNQFAQSLR